MELNNQYAIILRKKIPYVSEFFLGMLSLCLIIIAICLFLFMPALRSSNEMKVVATIAIIPDSLKWLILYSGIGLLIFWLLYKNAAFNDKGLVVFKPDVVAISTNKSIYQIPVSSINKIELIDPVDYKDDFKGKFIVVIYSQNDENFRFQLKQYNDCINFIDTLATYDILRNRIKNLNKTFLSDSSI